VAAQIIEVIKTADPTLFTGGRNGGYYDQVIAASAIAEHAAALQAAIPGLSADTLAGINFDFLGINLGAIPSWKIWAWDAFNWANIGAFLIPLISAGSQVLQMWITQKSNDSVVTNEKGVQDQEMAANSQSAQTTKSMMLMMPLMSLWIGFTVSAGLSLYWFIGGVFRMITDPIMTKHYRKVYDAEDAIRLQRAMEEEAAEAERERVRAERRAANPEGQTQNTSKKKLQKQQRDLDAAAKAAAKREYDASKGIVYEEEAASDCMSGIPSRPYCKGRNYDPNRYNTEE
jgi:YidC/Oxa1 family membrane protein insertase